MVGFTCWQMGMMVGIIIMVRMIVVGVSFGITPWKINMEPKNHPFRKENDLNQTSRELCSMLIFSDSGVYVILGRETLLYVCLTHVFSQRSKAQRRQLREESYIMAIVTIVNLYHPTLPQRTPCQKYGTQQKDLTY